MLQYPSVTPANGVLSPGKLGYGRLVHETFDACVLMLFQTCFESTCSFADVHLSTGVSRAVHVPALPQESPLPFLAVGLLCLAVDVPV